MFPTYSTGDIILVNRVFKNLNKGDIVSFNTPDLNKIAMKRIDKIQGETVYFHENEIQIPKGHVWLTGDNRGNSHDSRDYGPVPIGLIFGNPILRVPTSKLR